MTPLRPEFRKAAFLDLDTSADGSRMTGLAAVFAESNDLGGYTESPERGVFRKTLSKGHNIPLLNEHESDWYIATTAAGTLNLAEDAKGLRVGADISGKDFVSEFIREKFRRGEIAGMSYGMIPDAEAGPFGSRIERRGGRLHRTILGISRILDVIPTWDPAYPDTTAEVRSMRAPLAVEQLLEGFGDQFEDGLPRDAEGAAVSPDESGANRSAVAARKRRLTLLDLEG